MAAEPAGSAESDGPGAREGGRAVRLLHFTDTHLFGDTEGRLRGVATLASFRSCLEHARRNAWPVDAVVMTGDLVHDDPDGYGLLELALAGVDTPVLVVAGNHDRPAQMRGRLSSAPFQTDGALAAGAWQLLLLETWYVDSVDGEGRLGAAALEGLETLLASRRDAHVLLCLHHPPLLMDAPDLDALRLTDAEALRALVARHPQVRAVLWGHAHQALDVLQGGVRWMCSPSTCFQFRTRAPGFDSDTRTPGYRLIDLAPDGGLATEVHWLPEGWSA